MTFEEAVRILMESEASVGLHDYSMNALELMKADAMQKQAEAIERLERQLSDIIEKWSQPSWYIVNDSKK